MNARSDSDEAYIISLCDEVLGHRAIRQHRFDFLLGDPGQNGARRRLPVDAWYPGLRLVVEYHERQHTEAVALFDRRQTVSGMSRGDQRQLYDQRRRDTLPAHGIAYVELDVSLFPHDSAKRLKRTGRDRSVVGEALAAWAGNRATPP